MTSSKWFEKYLPFVAQSLDKQFEWLQKELKRSLKDPGGTRSLSLEEIQPYVRLLLEQEGEERRTRLSDLVNSLEDELVSQMLRAADIYDATTLFGLLDLPVADHVKIVLVKEPPSHEQSPHMISDKLFLAVHRQAPDIVEAAVQEMQGSGKTTTQFDEMYGRFKEMLMDEEVLSLLFPKAKA